MRTEATSIIQRLITVAGVEIHGTQEHIAGIKKIGIRIVQVCKIEKVVVIILVKAADWFGG